MPPPLLPRRAPAEGPPNEGAKSVTTTRSDPRSRDLPCPERGLPSDAVHGIGYPNALEARGGSTAGLVEFRQRRETTEMGKVGSFKRLSRVAAARRADSGSRRRAARGVGESGRQRLRARRQRSQRRRSRLERARQPARLHGLHRRWRPATPTSDTGRGATRTRTTSARGRGQRTTSPRTRTTSSTPTRPCTRSRATSSSTSARRVCSTRTATPTSGFWFLQNARAGLNANGSFSGIHVDGDILVQSEFTNGGSVSGVHIYKWQGGSLTPVSNQAQCAGGKLGTADACAIVNTGSISTEWAGRRRRAVLLRGRPQPDARSSRRAFRASPRS